MRVLVVDDEKLIVKGLKFSLEQDGAKVDAAYDGEEAVEMIKHHQYDMVLLDLMLPKISGYEVCKQVREFTDVPIIMLTAKGEDDDKIAGLNYGADDYITKPFNIMEVKARMNAVLRRISSGKADSQKDTADAENEINVGKLRLVLSSKRAYIDGVEYNLTSKEFEVLVLLCSNPDVVFSREQLLHLVWGITYPGDVRTVDVNIRRLREKIEPNPADPIYVHTKWGVGYYYKEK